MTDVESLSNFLESTNQSHKYTNNLKINNLDYLVTIKSSSSIKNSNTKNKDNFYTCPICLNFHNIKIEYILIP